MRHEWTEIAFGAFPLRSKSVSLFLAYHPHRLYCTVTRGVFQILADMDVSNIQVPDSNMTLEEYIEFLFTAQQEHLAQHIQTRLDVRSLHLP